MTEGHLISIGLLAVMVVSAACALAVKDLLAAAALFGVFSFSAATWFALMGAVDVAFTEACVGGALTTILFVSTAFRTSRRLD
ncbi:MAG: DUF4040 domain-containing protein [Acidobacteria bacterium]|nr:DUF4040 domain-containing protein [Acidobacteriota bacterium]